jgi:DNA-binding NarL/FixJ family response regulator
MRPAPLTELALDWRAPAAVVVTDEPRAWEGAARLLRAAGFAAEPLAAQALGEATADLAVLLLAGRAADRLAIIRAAARAARGVPLLVTMPGNANGSVLRRALRDGADGIVLDAEVHMALVPTARALLAGQLAVPRALRRRLAPPALSHREKEILALVVRGQTNAQIAERLFVAESTVKTHLSSAFSKLDAGSRAEAAALILDPDEGPGLGVLGTPGLAD